MLLLAAVESGATHGYMIAEKLRSASDGTFDLPDGTIYPALRRLEGLGLLKSSWDETGGRRRRTYKLTAKGKKRLAAQRQEWGTFERGVQAILRLSGP